MDEFNDKNTDNDKKDNKDSTDEFSMSNYSGYDVSHTENYDSSSNNDDDYEIKTLEKSEKKHRHGMGKRIASYIAVGLICSVLGGTVSGIATMYILPKTSFFKNTPLYNDLANSNIYTDSSSSSSVKASPTVASGSNLTVAQIAKKLVLL